MDRSQALGRAQRHVTRQVSNDAFSGLRRIGGQRDLGEGEGEEEGARIVPCHGLSREGEEVTDRQQRTSIIVTSPGGKSKGWHAGHVPRKAANGPEGREECPAQPSPAQRALVRIAAGHEVRGSSF